MLLHTPQVLSQTNHHSFVNQLSHQSLENQHGLVASVSLVQVIGSAKLYVARHCLDPVDHIMSLSDIKALRLSYHQYS